MFCVTIFKVISDDFLKRKFLWFKIKIFHMIRKLEMENIEEIIKSYDV